MTKLDKRQVNIFICLCTTASTFSVFVFSIGQHEWTHIANRYSQCTSNKQHKCQELLYKVYTVQSILNPLGVKNKPQELKYFKHQKLSIAYFTSIGGFGIDLKLRGNKHYDIIVFYRCEIYYYYRMQLVQITFHYKKQDNKIN